MPTRFMGWSSAGRTIRLPIRKSNVLRMVPAREETSMNTAFHLVVCRLVFRMVPKKDDPAWGKAGPSPGMATCRQPAAPSSLPTPQVSPRRAGHRGVAPIARNVARRPRLIQCAGCLPRFGRRGRVAGASTPLARRRGPGPDFYYGKHLR